MPSLVLGAALVRFVGNENASPAVLLLARGSIDVILKRALARTTDCSRVPPTPFSSMTSYSQIFENNDRWIQSKQATQPDFFDKLAIDQKPDYLYIGCSDSRVTAEEMMGVSPGEAFVHRNVANMVIGTDLNAMTVINYAVRHLGVKHVIVCGHYNCGGVRAAMLPQDMGMLNPWLRSIRDVYRLHQEELDDIRDETDRYNRLVELNVHEQCLSVIKTASVQLCYKQQGFPIVHGWVFDIKTGKLKDLHIDFEQKLRDIQKIYNLMGD